MQIGIVGNGVVGGAYREVLSRVHEVRTCDINPNKHLHSVEEVMASDLILICLPTPGHKLCHGIDASTIYDFFAGAAKVQDIKGKCFAIKSTVPIGTTFALAAQYGIKDLYYWPEFLTARTAVRDAANPRYTLIGCTANLATEANLAMWRLMDFYRDRNPGHRIHWTTACVSETVKLAMNAFFATKVGFFNELHGLCMGAGISYTEVVRAMVHEGRIAEEHTRVPGPDGQQGFGGTCLPKDLSQFIMELTGRGLPCPITASVLHRNCTHDRKEQQS